MMREGAPSTTYPAARSMVVDGRPSRAMTEEAISTGSFVPGAQRRSNSRPAGCNRSSEADCFVARLLARNKALPLPLREGECLLFKATQLLHPGRVGHRPVVNSQ